MNILVLTSSNDSFNSVRPELEIYVSLAKAGQKITMMTEKDSAYASRLTEHGIEIIDTVHKKKISLKIIKQIKKIIKEKNIDIIYATGSRSIPNSVFAAIGTDVKVVAYRGTTGGMYRHDPSSYLSILNPRVDGVVCVSQAVNDHVSKQVFSNPKKIVTIHKGHDISWYNQEPIDLHEFGTNKNNFNITCVANARPHKGLIYLIKAAHELSDIKNIHILLIGKNIDEEPYISEIENSGMKERIHVTGFRGDVPQIIAACDVLVHPSIRKEGLPRVILESLAGGTPVIASTIPGSMEIIDDGFNGYIVEIKDYKGIADKVKELYNSPEILQKLSKNGKYTLENKMSHKLTTEKYVEYFELLLKK